MENEEKNQTEQSDKSRSVWRELWDYAKIIIAVFVIAFLLGHFVYINARVPSGSMEETIMTGDRVFGNRLAYIKDDPERFDIVIFKYPDDPSQLFVKSGRSNPRKYELADCGIITCVIERYGAVISRQCGGHGKRSNKQNQPYHWSFLHLQIRCAGIGCFRGAISR